MFSQFADAVMITRQELGSDISPKKLVVAQKNMIARANKVCQFYIVTFKQECFGSLS